MFTLELPVLLADHRRLIVLVTSFGLKPEMLPSIILNEYTSLAPDWLIVIGLYALFPIGKVTAVLVVNVRTSIPVLLVIT